MNHRKQLTYLAFGAEIYQREAIFSIASSLSRSTNRNWDIRVFTDSPELNTDLPVIVAPIENTPERPKQLPLLHQTRSSVASPTRIQNLSTRGHRYVLPSLSLEAIRTHQIRPVTVQQNRFAAYRQRPPGNIQSSPAWKEPVGLITAPDELRRDRPTIG